MMPARSWRCASTSRSRGTIWVSTICAALPTGVDRADHERDHIEPIDRQPAEPPRYGTRATVADIDSSPTIYTGSLRRGRAIRRWAARTMQKGTNFRGRQKPICVAMRAAARLRKAAARERHLAPNEEMRIELHKRRYVRSRSNRSGSMQSAGYHFRGVCTVHSHGAAVQARNAK